MRITIRHTVPLAGDLAGIYYPLGAMSKEVEDDLQNCGFLFQKPTPNNVLANCGAARGGYLTFAEKYSNERTTLMRVIVT